jgi:hypothetical protein
MQTSICSIRMLPALLGISTVIAIGLSATGANSQPAPAATPAPAAAPAVAPQLFEYAVKFVCNRAGVSTPQLPVPVAPGFYHTAINVHYPSPGAIEFRKKFVQALPFQKPGRVTELVGAVLKSDEAFDVECMEITKRLGLGPGTFATGFVVFQTARELDIVAVYTAAGSPSGPVAVMHTERVPKRP